MTCSYGYQSCFVISVKESVSTIAGKHIQSWVKFYKRDFMAMPIDVGCLPVYQVLPMHIFIYYLRHLHPYELWLSQVRSTINYQRNDY